MGVALELMMFIGLFALAVGLLSLWLDRGKSRLHAAAESRRQSLQPWAARDHRRGHF
jgi:hypothetical protein